MEGSGSVVLTLGRSRRAVTAAIAQRRSTHMGQTGDIQQLLLNSFSGSGRQAEGQVGEKPDPLMSVLAPCTSTIFGVILFLRLGFVVGEAGWWASLLVIFVSFLLCLLTMLSICALISDGGDAPLAGQAPNEPGLYVALRQSVGMELGAALGASFYLAYVVDVAFFLMSFSAALCDMLGLRNTVQILPWNPPGTWLGAPRHTRTCALSLSQSRALERFALTTPPHGGALPLHSSSLDLRSARGLPCMCSRVRAPRPRATEVAVASIALLLLGLAIVFFVFFFLHPSFLLRFFLVVSSSPLLLHPLPFSRIFFTYILN